MLFGYKRAEIGVKFLIVAAILTFVFAAYSAVAELSVSPAAMNINQSQFTIYNIVVNNSASDLNFTHVNITLPAGFIFVSGSNATDVLGADFANDSSTLSWNKSDGLVLNQSWNQFWFNAITNAALGYYNISIVSLDTNGVTNSSNITVRVSDNTFPLVFIVYPVQGVYGYNVSELNFTASDSYLDSCWYSWNSGANNFSVACGTNATNLISLEGFNYWTVWVNDSSGNVNSSSILFTKDTISPLVLLNSPGGGDYSALSSILFNWSVIDAVATNLLCNLTLDGIVNVSDFASQNGSSNSTIISGLADGIHYWNVSCADNAGNSNISTTWDINVDTTFPSISFSGDVESSGVYRSRNWTYVNISAYDNNESSVIFSLYNATWNNITALGAGNSTFNWTNIPDGVYYYNVSVADLAGNRNSTETRNITLDTKIDVSYSPSSDDEGANYSRDWIYAGAYFSTEPNPANITFRLYGSAMNLLNTTTSFGPTDYVVNWTGLNDSIYYFNFTGYDLAGNKDDSSSTRKITLDTTNPNATLTNPGNGSYQNNPSQNYTAALTDNLGLKNATLNIYNSTNSLINQTTRNYNGEPNAMIGIVVNLANGVYKWFYSLFDFAGNNFISENRTLTIDTIFPTINFITPVTESGGSYVNRRNIYINVSANDTYLANITIKLYNSTNEINSTTTSTSPNYVNITVFSDGVYWFNATAVDLADNKGYTGTRNVTVDTIYPLVAITAPGNGTYWNRTNVAINYTLAEINKDRCWWTNNSGITNTTIICGVNITTYNAAQGWNNIKIYANDSAGNVNSGEIAYFVDSINPGIRFASPTENNGVNKSRDWIEINVSANDTNFVSVAINLYNSSLGFVNSSSGSYVNFSGLPDGIYWYNASAIDLLGNVNSTETRKITLDRTLPLVVLNSPANGANASIANNPRYNWTATDNLSPTLNCTFRVLGAQNYTSNAIRNSGNTVIINPLTLAPGFYDWNVSCTDSAGNVNSSETRRIGYDLVVPSGVLISPQNGNYSGNSMQNFTANLSDNMELRNATFNISNSTWSASQPFSFSGITNTIVGAAVSLADGTYSWFYRVFDWVGNGFTTGSRGLTVDTIWPSIDITSPANGANLTTAGITINYLIIETNPESCRMTNNSGVTNITVGCNSGANGAVYSASQEWNTIVIYVRDRVGHESSDAVTFYVDSLAPVMSYILPTESDGANIARGDINVNVDANDSGIGLANITVNIYNSTSLISSTISATSPNTVNLAGLADGIYYFDSDSRDLFGNRNSLPRRTVRVDRVAPTFEIAQTFSARDTIQLTVSNINDIGGGVSYCTSNRGPVNNSLLIETGLQCDTYYNYTVSCFDYAGNAGNVSGTFRTSSCLSGTGVTPPLIGGGGGGGGSSKIYVNKFAADDSSFGTEYNKIMGANDIFTFNAGGAEGYIAVNAVNEKTVNILVASSSEAGEKETLTAGQTSKFETDGDGNYDIQITLNSIDGGKADLTIKYIDEKIISDGDSKIKVSGAGRGSSGITGMAVSSDSGEKENIWQILIAGIIILGVIIGIIFAVVFFRK